LLYREANAYYPFIHDAISKLGYERIETLRYSQKAIVDELNKIADSSSDYKIFKKLNLEEGKFYSNSTIKQLLQQVYQDLGYNRTSKAVDIQKYYYAKSSSKRINSKLIEGYTILNPKYKLTQ